MMHSDDLAQRSDRLRVVFALLVVVESMLPRPSVIEKRDEPVDWESRWRTTKSC
jgi:hypothetical protein